MIRIYDLLSYKQPHILQLLKQLVGFRKPRELKAEKVHIRTWGNDGPFEWWRSVMEEKPRPGKAGLLPGETKEAV